MSTCEVKETDATTEVAPQEAKNIQTIRVRPDADVYQNDDAVRLILDIPGASEQDLVVEVNDGVLHVNAEVHRGENELRTYERSFRLNRHLDVERIDANLHQGVLDIRIPYSEAAKPKRIQVKTS